MKALVLDQSTDCIGFAVVEENATCRIKYGVYGRLLAHGRIKTPPKAGLLDRLNIMRADLEALIGRYNPDEIVCENTQWCQRDSDSAGATGAILRVIKELAKKHKLEQFLVHPNTIKRLAAGSGAATKAEMIAAACNLWELPGYKIQDDNHADALCSAFVWLGNCDEFREKAKKKKG